MVTSERRIPEGRYDYSEDFAIALHREFTDYGARCWNAAAGGLNIAARIQGWGDGPDSQWVLKVPRRNENSRAFAQIECETLRLLSETKPPCDFSLPGIIRQDAEPQSFALTFVHGEVMRDFSKFTSDERYSLGHDMARMALWELNIDRDKFSAIVEQSGGNRWDWRGLFSNLEFYDTRFPTLSGVAQELLDLKKRIFPDNNYVGDQPQVIHGDMRCPNLTFAENRLSGVFDWGCTRIGSFTEEARGLYVVGSAAIDGYNDALIQRGQLPIDPDGVRFWHMGRIVSGLIKQLKEGIPLPEEFILMYDWLIQEYSDRGWSELSAHIDTARNIGYQSYPESGPPFGKSIFL